MGSRVRILLLHWSALQSRRATSVGTSVAMSKASARIRVSRLIGALLATHIASARSRARQSCLQFVVGAQGNRRVRDLRRVSSLAPPQAALAWLPTRCARSGATLAPSYTRRFASLRRRRPIHGARSGCSTRCSVTLARIGRRTAATIPPSCQQYKRIPIEVHGGGIGALSINGTARRTTGWTVSTSRGRCMPSDLVFLAAPTGFEPVSPP